MEVVNYTKFRENMTSLMELVNSGHKPLLVTRGSKKPVIMLSLEDYNGFQETAYPIGTINNKKALLKGIEDLKNEKFKTKQLIEKNEN